MAFLKKEEALANLSSAYVYPKMRQEQIQVLKEIIQNLDKKYFICELDVGVGKSGIAMTLANLCQSTFILSSTKQLQDQYLRDFEGSQPITSIKGRANYSCLMNENLNCENGPCNFYTNLGKGRKFQKYFPCFEHCHYYKLRNKALMSPVVVTSYQYLLRAFDCAQFWTKRDLVVFDEAHLLENEFLNLSEFEINPHELQEKFQLFEGFKSKNLQPFTEEGYPANQERINEIFTLVKNRWQSMFQEMKDIFGDNQELKRKVQQPADLTYEDLESLKLTHKDYYEIDKYYKKIEMFLNIIKSDSESWLIKPVKVSEKDTNCKALRCSPLFVRGLFHRYINQMGDKFLFMSATILDTEGFIRELGIPKDEVYLIKIKSPFEALRSPIYFRGFFDMKLSELNQTLPKLLKEIEVILDKYPNQRGIIHTGNYRIAKFIYENIDSKLRQRLLYRSDVDITNELLIQQHYFLKNSVLISPSMTTGVDLKDDLARFQIICKLPYMSLGDIRVATKAKISNAWYNIECLRTLVQATGRATRSEFDYSDTYILDGKALQVIKRFANQLSQWFIERFQVER